MKKIIFNLEIEFDEYDIELFRNLVKLATEVEVKDEQGIIEIFNLLPDTIKADIYQWELCDTPTKESVFKWLYENKEAVIAITKEKSMNEPSMGSFIGNNKNIRKFKEFFGNETNNAGTQFLGKVNEEEKLSLESMFNLWEYPTNQTPYFGVALGKGKSYTILNVLIEKYGEEEGRRRYLDRKSVV